MIPQKGDLKASIAVIKTFFGKGEEPPFDKYLPEQRLAYFGMAAIIAVIIITGLVKTYKNVYAPDLSHTLIFWSTWLHNISFVFFVLAFAGHIGAIILKPNRPMVRGIFTGAVRLDYARHRHPLWLSGSDAPALPPPEQAVDKSDLVETGAVMNDDTSAGGSGEPPSSLGADTAGLAEMDKTEAAQGGSPEFTREVNK